MAAESAAERTGPRRVHDFSSARDRGDGHSSAERFRRGDEIRLQAEMLGSEPLAGTRESGLDFVRDEKDAVLAADGLEKLEIITRRNDEAAFAKNGLGDHCRNGFRRDRTLEGVFE